MERVTRPWARGRSTRLPVGCSGSAAGAHRRRRLGKVFSIRGHVRPELSRQMLQRAPLAWQDSSPSSSLLLGRQGLRAQLVGALGE